MHLGSDWALIVGIALLRPIIEPLDSVVFGNIGTQMFEVLHDRASGNIMQGAVNGIFLLCFGFLLLRSNPPCLHRFLFYSIFGFLFSKACFSPFSLNFSA